MAVEEEEGEAEVAGGSHTSWRGSSRADRGLYIPIARWRDYPAAVMRRRWK